MACGGSASPRMMTDLASAEGPNAGAHSYPRFPGQVAASAMPRKKGKPKKKKKGGGESISTFHCTNPSLLASESEIAPFRAFLDIYIYIRQLSCAMAEKVATRDVENAVDVSSPPQSDLRFSVRPNEDSTPSPT
jgi:hypothetical protein